MWRTLARAALIAARVAFAGVSAELPARTFTFRIGDAFPAADPVARFVAVLAMIYNDWRRTMDAMVASVDQPDGMGVRLLHFRQLVSYSHEATDFLTGSRKRYEEIDRFIASLNQEALDHLDKMFSALIPVEDWIRRQRHSTFHYPSMVPAKYEADKDLFAKALAAAADETSSATLGDTYGKVRFEFVDAVVVHLLGFKLPKQEAEFRTLVQALSDARYALGVFVVAAVSTYLASLPSDILADPPEN